MKKLLLIITLMLISITCFSQSKQTVLGLDTHTTMKLFNEALAKKGYKPTQTAAGRYEYNVQFAGYQNCKMKVTFNNGDDSIRFIKIFFPHESYSKDQEIYNDMTKQFKEKYGNEFDLTGGFMSSLNPTHKMKTYGTSKDRNQCTVSIYHGDDEVEDAVHIEYVTGAKADSKVTVSGDI